MILKQKLMKLSDKTLNVLKNFSSINPSLLFKKGNTIKTISVASNILAEVKVSEDFPKDFAIYDLTQFLNVLNLHSNPELDFQNDEYLIIRENNSRSKYFFSEPKTIIAPPEKELQSPEEDVRFQINTRQLDQLKKAASVYQLPDISVVGENGVIKLVVRDKKNDTSNDFSIIIGETKSNFVFNFKEENLKIIPGSYDVVISKKLLSQFKSIEYDLTYYIALELDSEFSES